MERLAATGGRIAASIADLARESDVVMTVLPDSPDVEAVVLGDDGVFAHARAGALCIDMSTVRPATAVMLNQAALARGLRFIDAPISGGEQGAVDGALSIMAGGSVNDFDAAQPVFRALGTTIVHVGSAGSGQTAKAANQLIVAGTIELVAEALVFLEAHDVDTERAVEALAGGLAGSRILDRKPTGMRMREFEPGFRVDLHHRNSASSSMPPGPRARRCRSAWWSASSWRPCVPKATGTRSHSPTRARRAAFRAQREVSICDLPGSRPVTRTLLLRSPDPAPKNAPTAAMTSYPDGGLAKPFSTSSMAGTRSRTAARSRRRSST
jgi:3-hydroxyisobutyrate dehydrogenase-like beta-hydroxyacid dehydrogenase